MDVLCECGRCRAMNTALESVCCREIPEVAAHIPECALCITSSNIFVQGRYRYTAYRQFVRWIWRRLGRRNRRVLPSCVVGEMRNAFPAQRYCGFRYLE
ncbi:uncharacterized protein LOC144123678 [Amblyomma americanum]